MAGEAVTPEEVSQERSFGALTERSPFTVTLDGEMMLKAQDGAATLVVKIEYPNGEPVSISVKLPLSDFPSARHFAEFAQATKSFFLERLRDAITSEALLHLQDVLYFVATDMGLEPPDKKKMIGVHLEETADRLSKWFEEIPDTPRRSRTTWTKHKLEKAARLAIIDLLQVETKITLDNIADEIRKHLPEDAPASGEALRKLLDRFGIKWRTLKADTMKLAKFRF